MLTLTENAADVVKQITEIDASNGADPGLRISSQPDESDGPGLVLSPADGPHEGDQILDESGARVYLDESAALMLEDKVLDAQVDADGSVQFAVGMQA